MQAWTHFLHSSTASSMMVCLKSDHTSTRRCFNSSTSDTHFWYTRSWRQPWILQSTGFRSGLFGGLRYSGAAWCRYWMLACWQWELWSIIRVSSLFRHCAQYHSNYKKNSNNNTATVEKRSATICQWLKTDLSKCAVRLKNVNSPRPEPILANTTPEHTHTHHGHYLPETFWVF